MGVAVGGCCHFPCMRPRTAGVLKGMGAIAVRHTCCCHRTCLHLAVHGQEGSILATLRLAEGEPSFILELGGSLNHVDVVLWACYGDLRVEVGAASEDGMFPYEEENGSRRYLGRNVGAERKGLRLLEEEFGVSQTPLKC